MDSVGGQIQTLGAEECYQLLAAQQVGRLGVYVKGYPLILPVNYSLDPARVIVFRTDSGTELLAANHANVTFEVDVVDQGTRSGWSVLVRGLAEEVTGKHDPALVKRTEATAVAPWAGGRRDHWMRIIPHAISGRRVGPHIAPTDDRGSTSDG